MGWVIRKRNGLFTESYLHCEIDPGGMIVYWTTKARATDFETEADAKAFEKRVQERYPHDLTEVVEEKF